MRGFSIETPGYGESLAKGGTFLCSLYFLKLHNDHEFISKQRLRLYIFLKKSTSACISVRTRKKLLLNAITTLHTKI